MTSLLSPLVIFSVIFALCVILPKVMDEIFKLDEENSHSSQSYKTLVNMNAFRIKTKKKKEFAGDPAHHILLLQEHGGVMTLTSGHFS